MTPFLDSVVAGTYPTSRLEVLVLDGGSRDGTREILDAYARRYPFIRVLDNPERTAPSALNLGILNATGEVIVRMDVHAEYPPNYVAALVEWLRRSGADNVGAMAVTCPGAGTPMARAIAAALAHPLGVGNSWFRIGVPEPRWVDTVPFGCFPRDVFARIGLFDEELVRNQDDELNARLRRAGGRILLVPDVTFRYHARPTLRQLARMYFQYGSFKPLALMKSRAAPTLRQLAPPAFVAACAAGAGAAIGWGHAWPLAALLGPWVIALLAAAALAAPGIGLSAALRLPAAFATMHFAYGVGYHRGLAHLASATRRGRRARAAVPLSR